MGTKEVPKVGHLRCISKNHVDGVVLTIDQALRPICGLLMSFAALTVLAYVHPLCPNW